MSGGVSFHDGGCHDFQKRLVAVQSLLNLKVLTFHKSDSHDFLNSHSHSPLITSQISTLTQILKFSFPLTFLLDFQILTILISHSLHLYSFHAILTFFKISTSYLSYFQLSQFSLLSSFTHSINFHLLLKVLLSPQFQVFTFSLRSLYVFYYFIRKLNKITYNDKVYQ